MVSLKRLCDTGISTLGSLFLNSEILTFTLEDTGTKQDSETFLIPSGLYTLRLVESAKFGLTYTIVGVKGHDLLRVHWGNRSGDTKGCVLTGFEMDLRNGGWVGSSRTAFDTFMKAMNGIKETPILIN